MNRIALDIDDRMLVEVPYRLMDGETEIKRKRLTPAKAAQNNQALKGTTYKWCKV